MSSFAYYEAQDFLLRKISCFELNIPTIIDGISSALFEDVIKKIIVHYGEGAICTVLNEQGREQEIAVNEVRPVPRLIVNGRDYLSRDHYTYGDLLEIIRRLRDEDGCAWDRVQTHQSIKNNAIEEAYELAEAIDLDDTDKIVEESGDVLLQGLFHASIAEEKNRFSPNDVINILCRKLITRHTHVFGLEKAVDAKEALRSWDAAKEIEKSHSSIKDKIDSVPVTFGGIMRALKVQKIIKKTGFDFPNSEEAKKKIYEELNELEMGETVLEKAWEGGDLLFAVVNYLRMLEIDPETAIHASTKRFIDRFLYVEKMSKEKKFELKAENIELMEKYYQESKKYEDSTHNKKLD